ncbi:hypothetical protein [Vasconcelosia minhoensis]|uniref:hypothetical protein n=1 Tax=Vasconcelosia minhoensis TaxID=3366354 RepID=UPI00187F6B7B|nr:hypothetical protein [Romeria gracilis]
MTKTIPLASQEVRWFFEGNADRYPALKTWFETVAPFLTSSDLGLPVWKERSDCYLLVPGGDDMGIKWREGEMQIKGRVSASGPQVFCGRHQGLVERWVKWSYADLPAAYRRLFLAETTELMTVSVLKKRALRQVRLDALTAEAEEVRAETSISRGLEFELTDLEVAGKPYCSLAFEAFPSDSAMDAVFIPAVEAFLSKLTELALTTANSRSYPAWLNRITA